MALMVTLPTCTFGAKFTQVTVCLVVACLALLPNEVGLGIMLETPTFRFGPAFYAIHGLRLLVPTAILPLNMVLLLAPSAP